MLIHSVGLWEDWWGEGEESGLFLPYRSGSQLEDWMAGFTELNKLARG